MTNVDRDPELETMHRSKKPLWVALAIVAALVVLVAALGPSIRAAFTGSETAASVEYNDTDVHFLGMMVPHHEQAIEMSDVLLASDVLVAIAASSFGVLLYYAVANLAALTQTGQWRLFPKGMQWLGLAGCVLLVAALPGRTIVAGLVLVAVGLAYRGLVLAARRR
mgnify:CR=1 FL=1